MIKRFGAQGVMYSKKQPFGGVCMNYEGPFDLASFLSTEKVADIPAHGYTGLHDAETVVRS